MEVLWTVIDRLGRPATLSRERLGHVLENHPDMAPWIEAVPDAVAHADAILRDPRWPHRLRHFRRVGAGRIHIRVVVNHLPTPDGWFGTVVTAHLFSRELTGESI